VCHTLRTNISKKKEKRQLVGRVAPARRNFFTKTLCVAMDFVARLCKIRHLAQLEADTGAVNKLYVKQRIKTLMNQHKESDERLTSFEKDVRVFQKTIINEFQRTIIKAELETSTNNNEWQ